MIKLRVNISMRSHEAQRDSSMEGDYKKLCAHWVQEG